MAADIVVFIHFAFILFVIFGGFLVLKWNKLIWLHIPAALWGAMIEFYGWICPLTTLENELLKDQGGGYATGFIEHYIIPVIYLETLNRDLQLVFGCFVIVINAIIYRLVYRYRTKRI